MASSVSTCVLVALLVLEVGSRGQAQTVGSGAPGACEPGWLPTFGVEPGVIDPGVGDVVQALEVFDDGGGPALFVGGRFRKVARSLTVNHIARWDGTRWSAVGSGLPGGVGVSDFEVFDDGTGPALYAAGRFVLAGGTQAAGIARWDGSGWSAVVSGAGVSQLGVVYALEVYDDGSGPALHAFGDFTHLDGVAANCAAKWNGVSWSPLGSGLTDSGGAPVVKAAEVYDDSTGPALYVGGSFDQAGTAPASNVARWDGVSWSPVGAGVAGGGFSADPVETLKVFDGGIGPELYAGGFLTSAGGATMMNRLAKWDGASWSAVGGGVSGTSQVFVKTLEVLDDGGGPALFVGGRFQSAGGSPANSIAKWNGTSWSTLAQGITSEVRAVTSFESEPGAGPETYVGGDFGGAGDVTSPNLARWNGFEWKAVGDGLSGNVRALLVATEPDGGQVLYAGGDFTTAGGVAARGVARWDGTSWSPLGTDFDSFATVRALEIFDDGTGAALYAGGWIPTAAGVAVNHVARWDGTSWHPLGTGVAAGIIDTGVNALAVYDDGGGLALYAGGGFTVAGHLAAANVARWDGATWTNLGQGTNWDVFDLQVFDDGSGPALYAAGSFYRAGGATANRIARWDGTTWSAVGVGPSGPLGEVDVYALAAHDGGAGPRLYAGGNFTNAGGTAASGVAMWDGANWSRLGDGVSTSFPISHSVNALASYDDGTGARLYVGGLFDRAGTQFIEPGRAVWPPWSSFGSGLLHISPPFSLNVYAYAVYDAGDGLGDTLVVAGNFSTPGTPTDTYIARWGGCSAFDPPATYCAGKVNSLGCVPFLTTTGAPSATATTPFRITANDMVPEVGNLFYGFRKGNLAFHGGTLCVKQPLQRLPHKMPKAAGPPPCPWTLNRDFNQRIQSGVDPQLTPGQTVFAQWRGRDPSEPLGFGDSLTDAVKFAVAP